MADARDKASPGDPLRIRATTWNQLVDLVEDAAVGSGESVKSVGGRITISLNATTHINPYQVVGFSDPVWAIDDSDDVQDRNDSATLNSAAPATGKWAICQGGAHIGDNVNAVLVGVTWAKINITDISHGYCEYTGGGLASAENGYARILWKPAGVTGSKWVVLQLGCSQGAGGETGCSCAILDAIQSLADALESNGSLSTAEADAQRAKIDAARTACGCIPTVECLECADGKMPATMRVTISGLAKHPYVTQDYNLTAIDIESAFNRSFDLDMSPCTGTDGFVIDGLFSGSTILIFDAHPTLGYMTWWLRLSLNYNGTPFAEVNFYGDDQSESCMVSYSLDDSDKTSTSEVNGPYFDTSGISISIGPAPS